MDATARVLVVDDESVVIRSCDRILGGEGIEVEGAVTGEDGVKRAEGNGFDLLLLDLKMPDTNGIEVLRRIKAVKPGLAVIIITGYPSVDTAVEAMKLGALDYVVKPFAPAELRSTVTKALKHRAVRKQAAAQVQPKVKVAPKRSPGLGLGRAIRTTTRNGKKVAIVGLAGVFEADSGLFSAVIESLKRMYVPITAEYGSHEVVGKEILAYLESNDKVVVVTSAHMGASPGQVVTFRAGEPNGRREDATFELPQIGFPHVVAWADAVGIGADLVVIGVEPNGHEGISHLADGLKQTVVHEVLAESP